MSPSVIYESICINVRRILINRPDKRNAIDLITFRQLQEAIRTFNDDKSAYVAILAGANGSFCSGYDLNEILDRDTSFPRMNLIEQMLLPLGTRLSKTKPIIAAIEGHAVGFGYELALRCDFRVADRDSRMGFLNRRFGIPIMNGGTVILPRLVGQARAGELIATGKAQLAHEAYDYGVVTYIAEVGCAQGRATALARCMAKFDQSALLNDLTNMNESCSMDTTKDSLQLERDQSLKFLKSCRSLDIANKFLEGKLCRHGNTDLGNILTLEPELTL